MKSGKMAFSPQFNMGTIYLLTQKFVPPCEGGRGMFHRTCDAMRTKHPPSPLRKGEIKVSTSILSPSFIVQTSPLALVENTRTRGHKLDFFCIHKLIRVTD